MLKQIIDLHIHSKYSRACSKSLELPNIAKACEKKGIQIVSTGDFTHPKWFEHLENYLVEENPGLYKLKDHNSSTRFILGTEVACIYKHAGKVRRIHLLLFAPSLECVKKFNAELEKRGVNIRSDGRPIMGLSPQEILRIMLSIDERFYMIPAHAWTPWFGILGSKSGYDSISECFEDMTKYIFAIETGLSSDPPMNHRLTQLDTIALISNSDAHSLEKLGREANILQFTGEEEITYDKIFSIIKNKNPQEFVSTIEFYPEEGKYHLDGHAVCGVVVEPLASKKNNDFCPKCRKKLTIGVMSRVEALADRTENEIGKSFVPHQYIVPLKEIIAEVLKVKPTSKKVQMEYEHMIEAIGSEFFILLEASAEKITTAVHYADIWLGISNMRQGKVEASGGYDGVFGTIYTLPENIRDKRQQFGFGI